MNGTTDWRASPTTSITVTVGRRAHSGYRELAEL